MLIDEAEIILKGGHGGAGLVSFGKMAKSGPDGGNGGRGGDLYVVASSDITLLNQFSVKNDFAAFDGAPGGRNRKTGKNGDDRQIMLPVGTTLIELETKRANELTTSGEEIELTEIGQRVRVAEGGLGGRGNYEFRSARRTTPEFAQSGLAGEERRFKVVLKLIADYGLIGLPNAGKSSLLNDLTNAKAKVGSYAFTTLFPNLGTIDGKVIADIPGLIEGASTGRGLGIQFLKHIEKVKVLLHCISSESTNLKKDYETIRKELGQYNPLLLEKQEIILITKSDLVTDSKLKEIVKNAKKLNKNVHTVSVYDPDSLNLISRLFSSQ